MKTLQQIAHFDRELNIAVFFFFLVFSSCAVSRTDKTINSDRISKINSRKYKERELTCISIKQHHLCGKSARLANGKRTDRFNWPKQNRITGYQFVDRKSQVRESVIRTIPADPLPLINPFVSWGIGSPVQASLQIPSAAVNDKANMPGEISKIGEIRPERSASTLSHEKDTRPDQGIDKNTMSESPVKSKRLPDKLLFFLLPVTALLSFLGLKRLKNHSHKISTWAYLNPWKTRFIIAGSHLLVGTGAILLGEELSHQQVFLGEQSRNILLATFMGTGLLYPVRKSHTSFFKGSFLRQKLHNLGMILSAFMLMVFAGNHNLVRTSEPIHKEKTIHQHLNALYKNSSTGKLVHFAKWIPGQDNPVSVQKKPLKLGFRIALTILAVLVLVASLLFLAALSCSLSCNGMEVLAFVVGIGGAFLLIFLFILALKAINRAAKRGSPAPNRGI